MTPERHAVGAGELQVGHGGRELRGGGAGFGVALPVEAGQRHEGVAAPGHDVCGGAVAGKELRLIVVIERD